MNFLLLAASLQSTTNFTTPLKQQMLVYTLQQGSVTDFVVCFLVYFYKSWIDGGFVVRDSNYRDSPILVKSGQVEWKWKCSGVGWQWCARMYCRWYDCALLGTFYRRDIRPQRPITWRYAPDNHQPRLQLCQRLVIHQSHDFSWFVTIRSGWCVVNVIIRWTRDC